MKVLILNLIFICGSRALTIIPADIGILESDFTKNTIPALSRRNALRDPKKLWPKGVIPYTLSTAFSGYELKMIKDGMAEMEKKTCIRFHQKSYSDLGYVEIIKGTGCSADLGRVGRRQELSLGPGCFFIGTILHEFMHTLGFLHEQSRSDRDKYIDINWSNINNKNTHNFHTLPPHMVQDLGEGYDFASVMHYFPQDFALDQNALSFRYLNPNDKVTRSNGFSESDIRQINKLYNCHTQTQNSGCVDKDADCVYWAQAGHCNNYIYYDFMKVNCVKACGLCT